MNFIEVKTHSKNFNLIIEYRNLINYIYYTKSEISIQLGFLSNQTFLITQGVLEQLGYHSKITRTTLQGNKFWNKTLLIIKPYLSQQNSPTVEWYGAISTTPFRTLFQSVTNPHYFSFAFPYLTCNVRQICLFMHDPYEVEFGTLKRILVIPLCLGVLLIMGSTCMFLPLQVSFLFGCQMGMMSFYTTLYIRLLYIYTFLEIIDNLILLRFDIPFQSMLRIWGCPYD